MNGSEPDSAVYEIKSRYGTFSEKEKCIADFILENTGEAVDPSIAELAKRIGISEATLVRFVKKIGFPGYQKFRVALARELASVNGSFFEIPVSEKDDPVDTIFRHTMQTLEASRQLADREKIAETVQRMIHSRRILLMGLGGSNINARDAYHKFIRTGLACQYTDDFHLQIMLASQAGPDDTALVFSHLGNNYDIISLADELRNGGCSVTAITSYASSPLADMADIVLQVSPVHSSLIAESFSASIATATLINVLYVEIMNSLDSKGLANLNKMRTAIAKRRS